MTLRVIALVCSVFYNSVLSHNDIYNVDEDENFSSEENLETLLKDADKFLAWLSKG